MCVPSPSDVSIERMLVAAAGARLLSTYHLPDYVRAGGRPLAAVGAADQSAERIREVLERNGFKVGQTAVDLGLSRHQLYRLVKRHGIRRQESSA